MRLEPVHAGTRIITTTLLSPSHTMSTETVETATKYVFIEFLLKINSPDVRVSQWVQITNPANGKSQYGRVRDECEGCEQNDLGLSLGVVT